MSKSITKADIDFEKELWDAANELRGAVSERLRMVFSILSLRNE